MRAICFFVCAAITYFTIHIRAQSPCVYPDPAYNHTFNYTCPIGTSCIVDTRYDPPGQLITAQPVGCCPDSLPMGCFKNDAYTGLAGCCGENQTCCYTSPPLERKWIGCANFYEQCCYDRICPDGYYCCNNENGHACCPFGSMCYAGNITLFYNGSNVLPSFIPGLENFSFPFDRCLPIEGYGWPYVNNLIDLSIANASIPGCGAMRPDNRDYVLRNITEGNYIQCGQHLCHNGDICITRYKMKTIWVNATLDISNPACLAFDPDTPIDWPQDCKIYTLEPVNETNPVGCCPPSEPPCGVDDFSFQPLPFELPQIHSVYSPLLGCLKPNETCCPPYICPADMKCCLTKYGNRGAPNIYPVNQTDRITPNYLRNIISQNGTIGAMLKYGQAFGICCPINTTCCQIQNLHPIYHNPYGEFFPFCGTDENCTTFAMMPQYLEVPGEASFEGIPATDSMMDLLSEGWDSLNTGSLATSKDPACFGGFKGNKHFISACGSLGGQKKNPSGDAFVPPRTGKYLDNTDPTEQIVAEEIYNVSFYPIPSPPMPP